MGLARQEHDARIQPWEQFATHSTEPALINAMQCKALFVILKKCTNKYIHASPPALSVWKDSACDAQKPFDLFCSLIFSPRSPSSPKVQSDLHLFIFFSLSLPCLLMARRLQLAASTPQPLSVLTWWRVYRRSRPSSHLCRCWS